MTKDSSSAFKNLLRNTALMVDGGGVWGNTRMKQFKKKLKAKKKKKK